MKLTDAIRDGKNYWLGPVVKVHTVAEYNFLEYEHKHFCPHPKAGQLSGEHHFSIFINGDSISVGTNSLDEALVQAISYKHAGPNSQAGSLFMRMIQPWTERPA